MPGPEEPAGWGKYIPKQGTGIAGRMSTVAMVALAVLGAGVYTLPPTELKLHGMLVIAGTFLIYLLALVVYAWMNPLHASLEGGQLVEALEIAEKDKAPTLPAPNVPPPPVVAAAEVEGGPR